MPEWDEDQRLQYEKEVLGFYFSGHPLLDVRAGAPDLGAASILVNATPLGERAAPTTISPLAA